MSGYFAEDFNEITYFSGIVNSVFLVKHTRAKIASHEETRDRCLMSGDFARARARVSATLLSLSEIVSNK